MFTTVLVVAVLSGCPGYGPCASTSRDGRVRNYGHGYRYLYGHGYFPPAALMPNPRAVYPLPSPWNAAVAELRSQRANSPRPTLSPGTQAELQTLAAEAQTAYDYLRNLPPEDKADARGDWIRARGDLERARIRAARELRR